MSVEEATEFCKVLAHAAMKSQDRDLVLAQFRKFRKGNYTGQARSMWLTMCQVIEPIAGPKQTEDGQDEHDTDRYLVVIDCCTSGNCGFCHNLTPVGVPARRLHSDNVTHEQADRIVCNWRSQNAQAYKM